MLSNPINNGYWKYCFIEEKFKYKFEFKLYSNSLTGAGFGPVEILTGSGSGLYGSGSGLYGSGGI